MGRALTPSNFKLPTDIKERSHGERLEAAIELYTGGCSQRAACDLVGLDPKSLRRYITATERKENASALKKVKVSSLRLAEEAGRQLYEKLTDPDEELSVSGLNAIAAKHSDKVISATKTEADLNHTSETLVTVAEMLAEKLSKFGKLTLEVSERPEIIDITPE